MIEQTCSEIAKAALNREYLLGAIIGGTTSFVILLISAGVVFLLPISGLRKNMLAEVKYLIDRNKGVVTVIDLVLTAQVSPEKATKFLVSFAQKLNIEPEVEEGTGTRFYRFNNAEQLAKRLALKDRS